MTSIGAVLAGKYRVERVLGQGGMGMVVQAMHLQLGQPVAMKFLLPGMLGNPQVVQRFLREAQAAVRLKSEHVARVIDVGTLDAGEPYMVLEYLDGTDLASFPRAQLSVGVIVDLMLQACEALAEAHALDIIHRDIKPANFFVTSRAGGSLLLKILDFGISKAPASDGQLTGTQMVMGTPAYMSPEQMKSSRSVDGRSDIWSLGIVLYELLQGATPFRADTFSSMIIKVATEELPPMTVRLPGRLAEVVYRCLDKDITRRFQNVAELALALAPYAQSPTQATISVERTSRVVGSMPPRHAPQPSGSPATITGASGAVSTVGTKPRRWPIIVGSAGAALVAAVIIIAVASRGPATEPAPDTLRAGSPSSPAAITKPVPPPAAAAAPPSAPPPAAVPTPPAAPAVATPPPVAPSPEPSAARPETASAPAPVDRAAPAAGKPRTPSHSTTKPVAASDPRPAATDPKPKSDPKAKPQKPRPVTPSTEPGNGSEDILGTRN